jgi:hypothetical protein
MAEFDGLIGLGAIPRSGHLIEVPDDWDDMQAIPMEAKKRVSELEDIYVFPVRPSNQAPDAYGTRMSMSALEQYRLDAIGGTPLMESHRTGGWDGPPLLPMGYTFHGELVGDPVDESPILGRDNWEVYRDYDWKRGAELRTWDYVARGYYPNGQSHMSTDDLIRGIESKSVRSISIGFWHKPNRRIQYVCSLCGKRMYAPSLPTELQCMDHAPLVKDRDSGVMAYAWVRESTMNEHSVVWKGATPGAMIEQARMVLQRGLMSAEEQERIEELYRVQLKDSKSFLMEGRGMDEKQEVEERQEVVEEPESDASSALDVDALAEQLGKRFLEASALDSVTEAVDRLSEMAEETAKRVDEAFSELEAFKQRKQQEAKEAELEERKLLLDRLVKERVRALGQGFDEEVYRNRWLEQGVSAIKDELKVLEVAATRNLEPGRPTGKADKLTDVKTDVPIDVVRLG